MSRLSQVKQYGRAYTWQRVFLAHKVVCLYFDIFSSKLLFGIEWKEGKDTLSLYPYWSFFLSVGIFRFGISRDK